MKQGTFGGVFPSFALSERTLPIRRQQPLARQHQIGQTKQRDKLLGVLVQFPVAGPAVAEDVFFTAWNGCSTLARMRALSLSICFLKPPHGVFGSARRLPFRMAMCQFTAT